MAENITGGYFVYAEEDGDALITNYSGEDTIYIASGEVDGYYFDDEDLILTVGDGSIRLQYMKGRAVTIMTSDSVTTSQIYGTDYSAQDTIKNLVKAWSQTLLTGTAKLDESIKLCSHFYGIQDAIDHMIADCKAAGNANTFLRKYCGIILGNADTGAITGWDAGGSSVKTAAGVVPETSTVQHITNYTKASFVRDDVTINIAEKLSSLTADGKKVLDGLYSWWAEEALKLVEESYGVEMAGNKINIALTPSATYRALTTGNDVSINMQGVTFNDTDDYQGNGIDRTIAHEFTHVAQNLFMGYFPQFLMEGLADLTCGIDDKRKSYINALAGNADSLASYLDLDTAGTGSAFHYAAGYMFYRYLAKQASSNYDSLTAHAWEDNVSISGTNNNDFLTGNGFNQTLSAGAGNDTITTYGDSAQIQGGAGDDTIYNRGDNVLIEYRAGDGSDIIEGFNESSTLRIVDDAGTCSTLENGSDIIVSVGDDSISLIGAATLNKLNIDGKASTHLTLNNSDSVKVYLNASIEVADASTRTKAITIVGNALDNSIIGSPKNDSLLGGGGNDSISGGKGADKLWGGNGADTLWGGTGNDTLYGGAGKDLFIYTAGKDVISDYAAGDVISLGSAITKTALDGSDAVLTFGTSKTLTIKNGKGKTLSLITSDGKELETVIGSSTTLTVTNNTASPLTIDSTTRNVDASTRTTAIKITGNAKNNSIVGGSGKDTLGGGAGADTLNGGAGNDSINGGSGNDYILGGAGNDKLYGYTGDDTLIGGAGNDSLWGQAGADTFIYNAGDGKDVIYGFDDTDMLEITGDWSAAYVAADDAIYFRINSAYRSVTLKDFTADTFNVNGDTYYINDNNKFVKK